MFFRSTLSAVLGSIILRTESTAIGASLGSCATIFEESEVEAALRRVCLSERLMGMEMEVRTSTACFAARWKESEMMVGWRPFCSRRSEAPRRDPAITTTEVVPSPASISWAFARSTSIFAAGCMTDMSRNMVLPSLVWSKESVLVRGVRKLCLRSSYDDGFALAGLNL